MEYLEVRLDDARFALPAEAVVEVLRAAALARVGQHPFWDGVLNLRGKPVPILDLRAVLGFSRSPLDPSQYFVVLEHGQERFGVRVDAVNALTGLRPADERGEELQAACPVAARYLLGGDSVIPLLSVCALWEALHGSGAEGTGPAGARAVAGRSDAMNVDRGGHADASKEEQRK